MNDYSNLGFNNKLRKGLAARASDYRTASDQDIKDERSPWAPPTLISKGTIQTASGGLPQFKSTSGTSGGTTIMDVDPDTGTVTIRGGLVAQQTLDLGTINDTVLAGTPTLAGTLTNNRLINNGTWNTGTFGTPNVTGGTFGTPEITGGTHNNAFFGTIQTASGTIGTPRITGTPTFDTNAGSGALSNAGDFAIQTFSGSAILVARLGTISYRFLSGGTF